LFPEVQTFITAVTTYVGGYFTFVAASPQKGLFKKAIPLLNKRFKKLNLETSWYSPQMHKAASVLPRELQSSLKKTEYGTELVIDLYDCDYSVITSQKKLLQFAKEVCEVINMKPFGKPFVADFGNALSKTMGPSLVQLIESSSITAHYSPHWRVVCMNVFTCTSFDPQKTLKFVKEFFGSGRAVAFLLKRGPRVFRKDLEVINIPVPGEKSLQ
jgi:S-adenosylmethionine/arginine decarboxylase-like enzyme